MTKKNKIKKVKGPIRTGAVVPFIIVSIVTVVFSVVFLDSLLKASMEMIGTKINGAQVDVGRVETSFSKLSLKVSKIEFTNKEDPEFNSFEIGQIHFEMLWDALLRAKIVINEVKVADIFINTKRKKTGYVVPPPSAAQLAQNDKEMKESLLKAKEEFKGNVFGDIAGVVAGDKISGDSGPVGSLKSKKKVDELGIEIKARQEKLEKMIKDLPPASDIKELEQRFNALDWKNLSNIAKAPKFLKEVDQIKKDADKITKAYNDANKAVNDHVKFVTSSKKLIDGFVDEDIKDLKNKMKIPSLDTKSIASKIFGPQIVSKIEMVQGYYSKYKKYLPPKKSKEEKLAKKNELKVLRQVGVNYSFGRPNSYPLLWIKSIAINSKTDQGEVSGSIKDITSDQAHINRPTLLTIDGDFAPMEIRDVRIRGTFDHRKIQNDRLSMVIGSYPVVDKALSDTDDVKFIIKKASVKSIFEAKFAPENVFFTVDNSFGNIDYEMDAKSSAVKSILNRVAKSTKLISLNASATGKMSNLNWKIQSNLAQEIEKAAKDEINEKLKAINDKIKKDIEAQIASQKEQIDSQLAQFKNKTQSQVDTAKKQIDDFKGKLDKKKKDSEKKSKPSAKDLLKKIKF